MQDDSILGSDPDQLNSREPDDHTGEVSGVKSARNHPSQRPRLAEQRSTLSKDDQRADRRS